MKTVIYYYTGTGNSLWTARTLAQELGDTELIPMTGGTKPQSKPEAAGFVFPVHMWGVPGRILEFIRDMEKSEGLYYFAVAVNAGQVSRTLIQLEEEMRQYKMRLSAGISVELPGNYVPWGGPGTEEEMKKLGIKAEEKIKKWAPRIKAKQEAKVERGPLWQRIVFTYIYNMTKKHINMMDKNFTVDDKCNSCGICEKVCPAHNINMVSGKPEWNRKCQQCFACIQWCPQAAIQYGKDTAKYPRYHHPSVKLSDITASIK
ncbi:MAG: EFR1 family ferrodoxin [Spirochaetia bacterium]|nr:EFR1 family ferrodoxin [Spirochaetia bacterium]